MVLSFLWWPVHINNFFGKHCNPVCFYYLVVQLTESHWGRCCNRRWWRTWKKMHHNICCVSKTYFSFNPFVEKLLSTITQKHSYLELSLHSIACCIPVVRPTRTQRNHHSYEPLYYWTTDSSVMSNGNILCVEQLPRPLWDVRHSASLVHGYRNNMQVRILLAFVCLHLLETCTNVFRLAMAGHI